MPSDSSASEGMANAFLIACAVCFFLGYACGKVDGLEARPAVPVEVRCVAN